jgi:hypothetical protein
MHELQAGVAPPSRSEGVRARCGDALREPALSAVASALCRVHGRLPDIPAIVGSVHEAAGGDQKVRELSGSLARAGFTPESASLERFLLLRCCLHVLDEVERLPVSPRVRGLVYDAFEQFASPPERLVSDFALGGYPFVAMCKIASLRRMPAGQLEWERSGIPRSYFLRVPAREVVRLVRFVLRETGGLRPLFTPHFSIFRKHWLVLREREMNRSYYQMALALREQPAIRGMVAAGWLYSPATYEVSPHLSWLRRGIVENGGFAVSVGPGGAGTGVLTRSVRRRQLFEANSFEPAEELVIWPREAMLRWAAANPQYGERE